MTGSVGRLRYPSLTVGLTSLYNLVCVVLRTLWDPEYKMEEDWRKQGMYLLLVKKPNTRK